MEFLLNLFNLFILCSTIISLFMGYTFVRSMMLRYSKTLNGLDQKMLRGVDKETILNMGLEY